MEAHELGHHDQAEAEPGRGRVRLALHEGIEQRLLQVVRHARSGIIDGQKEATVVFIDAERDSSFWRGVLDRVQEKVFNDALELSRVHVRLHRSYSEIDRVTPRVRRLQDVSNDGADIGRLTQWVTQPSSKPIDIEDTGQEAFQVLAPDDDYSGQLFDLNRIQVLPNIPECQRPADDRAQRRPYFVRDGHEEVVLHPVEFAEPLREGPLSGVSLFDFPGPLADALLEFGVEALEVLMEGPGLEQVLHPQRHFDEVERLREEVGRSGRKRSTLRLERRISRDDKYWVGTCPGP